jgi:glycosyltransferase involved in cell wall biosynthesis
VRVAFHAGQLLQPVPGGIGRYEHAMLEKLGPAGVDVVAFAAGSRPSDVAPAVPWIDLGWPRGSLRYEAWHRLRTPRVRIDADLVHAPSLAIPPVDRKPLVVTIHDIAFVRLPSASTRRGVRFHRRGYELARRHADLVIVPSMFTARELEAEGFGAERVQLVRFGIDTPATRDDADIDTTIARAGVDGPFVLTVGTLEPRKDVPTLVHAMERVRTAHPDLTLVVVGPRGWGEVPGLDRPYVQVLGRQPWNVVDALYRRASAFVCASLYEGFGLPALEAMARGAPTISTTGSSMEEFVRDAGLLFEPRDVDACVERIECVLGDHVLAADLARRGRGRAAEMTWQKCADGHVRAYERALEGPRS